MSDLYKPDRFQAERKERVMIDKFSIGFIVILVYIAGFAFGWKGGQSWEKQKGENDDEF